MSNRLKNKEVDDTNTTGRGMTCVRVEEADREGGEVKKERWRKVVKQR